MPELPDVELYCSALERFIVGRSIEGISIRSPFLVRTLEPDVHDLINNKVLGIERIGKRIVWQLDNELYLVIHLMIAGRFHWKKKGTKPTRKVDLAAFSFSHGTLMLTEAGSKKRASLHVIVGRKSLEQHNPGGIEVLDSTIDEFREILRLENHTLKRSLTDPRFFSGIGNAYSDEILHRARLSPIAHSQKLDDGEINRLFQAVQVTLIEWRDRLLQQTGDAFPEKVTAFRPEMAVHGRFGKPCPDCATPVQRIVYAENETNYCPACQTGGKVLADRSLSRLLKDDWPRSVDELENQ